MGRSVDYLNNAMFKLFFENDNDEMFWQWKIEDITTILSEVAPSLSAPRKDRWDGRETKIILENNHCEIGVSEYCGITSISIRVIENDYSWKHESLSRRWIDQMWGYMVLKIAETTDLWTQDGRFSDGTCLYGKFDSELFEYNLLKKKLMGNNSFVVPGRTKNWKRFNELSAKRFSIVPIKHYSHAQI